MRALTGAWQGRKLFNNGEPGWGRITGIRVHKIGHDEQEVWVNDYRLEVEGATVFTCGTRDVLHPDSLVRIGMSVAVRHDGKDAVIDWPETCGGHNGEPTLLDKPPAEGIVDERFTAAAKARRRGRPIRATVVSIERDQKLFGRTARWAVEITEEGGTQRREWLKERAPHYAAHLAGVGSELPAHIGRWPVRRVLVDWPQAAMDHPGIGEPPAEVFAWLDPSLADATGR